ncbi:n-alpha-acetyltransferase 35, NatC auxiliary subunit [Trichonephila inaurata madagascariensis]|uniref:3',5'-cyclic-GMP phosphodiesterase n=1 Tax=Trichonephila inaurata madagascariensis TaxID=2747483 RepID=A0A8X7CEP0_9ARAC|nr:n-alpha-acetyltransferase 35, NatC auxiliary subunit [Trichonephila inaurata madagascariensis]
MAQARHLTKAERCSLFLLEKERNELVAKVFDGNVAEDGTEADKLKIKDLTVEEQIGIIDATLACLVTWLEGHSLAQTVFTNLYLQKPHLVEDKIIRAFSIHSLKLLDVIREFINKAGVFEEEDFQPVMYGYKLANDIPVGKATAMLKEVEEELLKKVKQSRSKPGEEQDLQVQAQHEESVALYSRIKFCRLLYQALRFISEEKERTIHLGIRPDPKAESSNRADYPTILGFEPLVNQRLLPPTFPRYTKIKTRKESVEYLTLLTTRLRTICGITECITFHSALDFLSEFSKTSPCVLSRSVLQLLYMNQAKCSEPGKVLGTMHIVDVLRDAIKAFIKPPALMPRSPLMFNPSAKEYVETFLSHSIRPFCTLVQISGHNRARQRDKLSHLLEELAALQEETSIEVRIPADQGIAGHVATSGELLNIHDAYAHPLFYRKMDETTGFKTRNILCFPIKDDKGVIGVAELCNKINERCFSFFDEEIAKAFAIYCGISIMHSLMWKKVRDAQHRSRLSNELMMYHMQVLPEDVKKLAETEILPPEEIYEDFAKLTFIPRSVKEPDTTLVVMGMFQDLGMIRRWRIPIDTLAK